MTRSTARRRGRDKHFKRGLKTALAVFAVLALMLITGSGFFGGHHGAADPGWQVPDIPASSENPDTQGGDEDAETTDAPDDPNATEPPAETKAPESGEEDARPSPTPNDCSMLVPESEAVDDSYFDDAVFIGNSRTEGLKMYSGLTKATFITEVGLTVKTIFTDYCDISGGYKNLCFSELESREFSKVYIMLGMNELGWVYESVFKEDYGKIIDKIREINPDAKIYIQSIIPVSKWKDSNDTTYTIYNVDRLNTQLRALADEKEVHYVDVAEGLMDEEGYLPYEATLDGVHLVPEYCVKWLDYLKTHTAQ